MLKLAALAVFATASLSAFAANDRDNRYEGHARDRRDRYERRDHDRDSRDHHSSPRFSFSLGFSTPTPRYYVAPRYYSAPTYSYYDPYCSTYYPAYYSSGYTSRYYTAPHCR